jgi:uncharacterized protein YqkB
MTLPLYILSFMHFFLSDVMENTERGSTVVKVLRYKSEGRWFDPRLCHGIFLLT